MKKTIIRTIIACLASVMLMAATGCGGSGDNNAQQNSALNIPGFTNSTTTQTSSTVNSTPIPTTSTVTPAPSAGYEGTYVCRFDESVLAGATEQELASYQQLMSNTYLILGSNGSLSGAYNGQAISGTWSDAGNGQINLSMNGNTLTYTIQNGMIYDPNDMSSYFQKSSGGTVNPSPTSTPTTSTVTPTLNTGYAGTYYAKIDESVLANLSDEQKAYYQQIIDSAYITLDANGSLTGVVAGQTATGSWTDLGGGQINLTMNGNTLTYTIQNGIIYDPNDPTSYFQKG